jgi:hypothetical protein
MLFSSGLRLLTGCCCECWLCCGVGVAAPQLAEDDDDDAILLTPKLTFADADERSRRLDGRLPNGVVAPDELRDDEAESGTEVLLVDVIREDGGKDGNKASEAADEEDDEPGRAGAGVVIAVATTFLEDLELLLDLEDEEESEADFEDPRLRTQKKHTNKSNHQTFKIGRRRVVLHG